MASRKKLPKFKILKQLSRRARREVAKLLKSTETRSLTPVKLDAGLEEVEVPLKQMLAYISETLDEVAALKRVRTRDAQTKKRLKSLDRRVERMWNFGNGDPYPH